MRLGFRKKGFFQRNRVFSWKTKRSIILVPLNIYYCLNLFNIIHYSFFECGKRGIKLYNWINIDYYIHSFSVYGTIEIIIRTTVILIIVIIVIIKIHVNCISLKIFYRYTKRNIILLYNLQLVYLWLGFINQDIGFLENYIGSRVQYRYCYQRIRKHCYSVPLISIGFVYLKVLRIFTIIS